MVVLVSFLKKITFYFIFFAALFLCIINFHLIYTQGKKLAAEIKPPQKVTASKQAAGAVDFIKRQVGLAPKQPAMLDHQLLDVPLIEQLSYPQLYNGCEVTSLAMILNYNGYHVTKNELAENINTVPLTYSNGLKGNPNDGFVGDMEDGPGLSVYNGPVFDLAKKYAGDKAENLTNSSFTDILQKVSDGEPVWVIVTSNFEPTDSFVTWPTPEGTIKITYSEHSVVITGYDKNSIYLNNPYSIKNEKVDRDEFEKAWEQMGSQAIVIEK